MFGWLKIAHYFIVCSVTLFPKNSKKKVKKKSSSSTIIKLFFFCFANLKNDGSLSSVFFCKKKNQIQWHFDGRKKKVERTVKTYWAEKEEKSKKKKGKKAKIYLIFFLYLYITFCNNSKIEVTNRSCKLNYDLSQEVCKNTFYSLSSFLGRSIINVSFYRNLYGMLNL